MKSAHTQSLEQHIQLFSLLRFTAPTMLMMLAMGLYTITDTIFIARLVNTNALSAVNIVCPVINGIVGLGTMLAAGGNAVIAHQLGAGQIQKARANFSLLFFSEIFAGIGLLLLGFCLLEPLLYCLGASPLLYPDCRAYLSVLLLFTPASMLQIFFQNFFVTAGRPGLGMALSLLAGACNILLDYLFMAPCSMGIAGAALGTGISYCIPALFGLRYFLDFHSKLQIVKPEWNLALLFQSCLNGSSEMVSQLATAFTTFLLNHITLRLLGENGVAAITIMIYSQFLLTALYLGFSMGTAPLISYNLGANKPQQLRNLLHLCFAIISVSSLLIFLFAQLAGSALLKLFAATDSVVYQIAAVSFPIFSTAFLCCGVNIFISAAFTALSDGKHSAIVSFLRTFGFLTICLLTLPSLLGMRGVWLAVPLAEAATMVCALWLWNTYGAKK